MRVIWVRHVQTTSNVGGLLDTAVPGAPPTELGLQQAAAVPTALAAERIDAIYVSTLIRTQMTAAPLARARGLEPRIRDGLREVSAGDVEMRGDPESVNTYLGAMFDWLSHRLDVRMPGAETGFEVLDRLDAVVAEAASAVPADGAAVLVSHGAAIRLWASLRSRNLVDSFGVNHGLGNTGMVVMDGTPSDGWRAVSWTGAAIGGPELDDAAGAGPTAEVPSDVERAR